MTAFIEPPKWKDLIDQPLTNRKARRHSVKKHNKQGFTKSNKKKR